MIRSDSVSLAGAAQRGPSGAHASGRRAGRSASRHPVIDRRAARGAPRARRRRRRTPPGRRSPASDRRSILRRCPNAVRTSVNSVARDRPSAVARRSIRTSADSTLGRGTNTEAGTWPTIRAVAQYATLTLTAPYCFVAGRGGEPLGRPRAAPSPASTRSPARSSSRSHTSGVATLYGRLATSVQRSLAASSDCQSARWRRPRRR